jgi:HPt (histidine-containing phosphotransfer) domain-containing protein
MVQVFNPQATPVLDNATLDQLLALDDGQMGLIQEMYQLYVDDTPDRIHALGVTVAEMGHADVAEVAHAIKGAASTMGAPRVQALAGALEAAGRREDMGKEDMLDLVAQLQTCFQESTEALRAFISARA